MFSRKLRRYLRLQLVTSVMASFTFGFLVSVLSNLVSVETLWLLPWITGVCAISGLVAFLLFMRRPVGIDVAIKCPVTIRTEQESLAYARRGFICFVPIYTPKRGSPADHLSAEERQLAIETRNFDLLKLEESNLYPTIKAILTHASRLEYCWVLATIGKTSPGSLPFAGLLVDYLTQRYGVRCRFFYGQAYAIPLDEDALVLQKTYRMVKDVLAEAERMNLDHREVVADFTTGFRSMTLGMILACLDGDQDLEFIGTRYNDLGLQTGDLLPIIFGFEPHLE